MKHLIFTGGVGALLSAGWLLGEPVTPDSSPASAVMAAVEGFHAALERGDAKAAMQSLAPDAIILESGFAQTRAEYEAAHLPEDIKFAQAIRNVRSDVQSKSKAKRPG